MKRVKRILDLNNGPSEITELLKELEEITKKGGTIKSGILNICKNNKCTTGGLNNPFIN